MPDQKIKWFDWRASRRRGGDGFISPRHDYWIVERIGVSRGQTGPHSSPAEVYQEPGTSSVARFDDVVAAQAVADRLNTENDHGDQDDESSDG